MAKTDKKPQRTIYVVKVSREWLRKMWGGLPLPSKFGTFVYVKCNKAGKYNIDTATVYSADELVERKCEIVSHNDE